MEKATEEWGWYNLKYDLSESIIPKLETYLVEYSKGGMSIPIWLLNEPKNEYSDTDINNLVTLWKSEINHMLQAFKQILNYKTGEDDNMDYDEIFIQEGLNKFAKHFQHFWD